MKSATKYAEDLKALLKRLMKEGKPGPLEKLDPLKALVRGAMSYDVSNAKAEEVMQAIDKEFVDLNELRVATDLEIQELLGVRYPAIEKRVAMITQSLNTIFEREHTMSLDRLRGISKRDARQVLRELPDMHPFVEGYVMLFAFEAGAMPMDDMILTYLKSQGVVDEKSSLEEAQKFVEHHLKGDECYELYYCLRRILKDTPEEKKKKK